MRNKLDNEKHNFFREMINVFKTVKQLFKEKVYDGVPHLLEEVMKVSG